MKNIKWRWFFRLLGMLALAMVVGMILTGCETLPIGGGIVLGAIIGVVVDSGIGPGIGAIIGGIIGLVIYIINNKSPGGTSGNSSSSSSSGPYNDYAKLRENGVRKCGSCTMFLSRGVCRRDDSPKSAEDSCSNWN